MKVSIESTHLGGGVVILRPHVHEDVRGWFMEAFRADHFRELGPPECFKLLQPCVWVDTWNSGESSKQRLIGRCTFIPAGGHGPEGMANIDKGKSDGCWIMVFSMLSDCRLDTVFGSTNA